MFGSPWRSGGWSGTEKLVSRYGPATGAWSHNERVTYWAREPVPDGSLTWVDYCARLGRSPEWTDDDRQGLSHPG
ncbi:MAG TPA: hypothetical protein VGP26_19470 [Actinophytocola sp.]|nr:hypothetical protein [Actinophytocola sp.]